MELTDDQKRKLAVFADVIEVAQNEFTDEWFWWTLGRNGFNSNWWCKQAPAGHAYTNDECDRLGLTHGSISEGPATISLDSLDPRLFALEKGYGTGERKYIVIDARCLAQNAHGSNVVLDLHSGGSQPPIFLRVNGMNLSIATPPAHDRATTTAFAQDFAQQTKGRALSDTELVALAARFPGPTWTDEDWDGLRAAIDRLP